MTWGGGGALQADNTALGHGSASQQVSDKQQEEDSHHLYGPIGKKERAGE